MPKPFRELSASTQSKFDMWRLGQAGGELHFKPNGQMVFRFKTKAQFDKYLQLNNKRGEWVS